MKEMALQMFNIDIAAFVLLFGFVIYPILFFSFIPDNETGDSMNKKSGPLKKFIYLILASGLLISLYLILYGIYSFSGWGDRISDANQIVENHEGRGTVQFLFIMYLGPLISIIWGMGIFALVKRVLRTGSV
tara:strand:+ start:579 stop:974 length:396 start_codon:yes stop_codon:yes gene_type:complete